MSELTQQQVHQIWLKAAEKAKDRVVSPTFYRAVELGVGITIEGDVFVLGFSTADSSMAGHIRSSQHLATVEQSLSEVIGRKVRLKIVDGTTIEDYENYLKLQKMAEKSRTVMSDRRAAERQIELAWEEVAEKITRGYAKLPLRQLPQTKGRFILDAFALLSEMVDKMGYSEQSDEMQQRAIARVFDKFSTVVEVPAAMLAYEFFRLRNEGKLG